MKKIVDQICKKMNKVENDLDEKTQRLKYINAEKDDLQIKYNREHEQFLKLQLDYDTLDKDV